jgi:hypothetical protein
MILPRGIGRELRQRRSIHAALFALFSLEVASDQIRRASAATWTSVSLRALPWPASLWGLDIRWLPISSHTPVRRRPQGPR